jgi:CHAT domain-containing protein
MVLVCLELERKEEALEYVERSKTRNLLAAIHTSELLPKGDIPPNVLEELTRLRQQIERESLRLRSEEVSYRDPSPFIEEPESLTFPSAPDRSSLRELQRQLDGLIEREIAPHDPDFNLFQKPAPLSYQKIQALTGANTAFVEWYITGETLLVFLLTPTGKLEVQRSSAEERANLYQAYAEYLQLIAKCKQSGQEDSKIWRDELPKQLESLAKVIGLGRIFTSLLEEKCDRLIFIPHGFLHILPLHALPLENGECSLDLFPNGVSYVPSCQLLHRIQQRERPNLKNLFAIANPTLDFEAKDLKYADMEVLAIQKYFQTVDLLSGEAATKEAHHQKPLHSTHCLHYSCHGIFNALFPHQSALLLAGSVIPLPEKPDFRYQSLLGIEEREEHLPIKFYLELLRMNHIAGLFYALNFVTSKCLDLEKCLILEEIAALDLRRCRLVTLSACETNLTNIEITRSSDEYIGLPSGFLLAGSLNVVGSLWSANDFSSCLLMIKFYENLLTPCPEAAEHSLSVAIALNQAQIWLRDLTKQQLLEWCENADLPVEVQRIIREHSRIRSAKPDKKLFKSPSFWAVFCSIGL